MLSRLAGTSRFLKLKLKKKIKEMIARKKYWIPVRPVAASSQMTIYVLPARTDMHLESKHCVSGLFGSKLPLIFDSVISKCFLSLQEPPVIGKSKHQLYAELLFRVLEFHDEASYHTIQETPTLAMHSGTFRGLHSSQNV